MRSLFVSFGALLFASGIAFAGEADVVDVQVSGDGPEYRFSVTVEHADTGWDHYANGWEVVGDDGTIYGERVLHHPHVDEQPFTRSGSISVPEGVTAVIVRAKDSIHGVGGKELRVDLPGR